MHEREAPFVLREEIDRTRSGDPDPEHVELESNQRRIGVRDEHVERTPTVGQRLEFESVVVIADLHARLLSGFTRAIQLVGELLEERLAAAAFRGHQIAHHCVLRAVRLRFIQRPLERGPVLGLHGIGPRIPVSGDERRLDVHADAVQPVRLRERRDPRGVRAQELDLLVSDGRDCLQRRIRVRSEPVAHGIELHAERPLALCEQRRPCRRPLARAWTREGKRRAYSAVRRHALFATRRARRRNPPPPRSRAHTHRARLGRRVGIVSRG